MGPQPEGRAREAIDELLRQAGWQVHDAQALNLTSWRGIAIREFPLKSNHGFADYCSTSTARPFGVIEGLHRRRTPVQRPPSDGAPEELEGRNQRSALFKTMFLAFRANGAKDWRSNLAIRLDHRGVQHRLQFHHIFPKAVLRSSYTVREADDIANLAFIGGKTNRQISDKSPVKYFPQLIEKNGTMAFETQCIPTEPELLDVDQYKQFLTERRKRISQRLNEFLGGSLSVRGGASVNPRMAN